jgi:hypothetical protein
MSQILKFPDNVSQRGSKDGTSKRTADPVMTGDQWNEFIKLLTPDEQQAFMADVWKLINRYCQRIGGE